MPAYRQLRDSLISKALVFSLCGVFAATSHADLAQSGIAEDALSDVEARALSEVLAPLRVSLPRRLVLGYIRLPVSVAGEALMKPTAECLREALPGIEIELRPYSEFDLQVAVVKREVDLYVVPSGFFAYLADVGAGSVWIASRMSPQSADPSRAAGSVFVARADDTRFANIADLRSAIVAASNSQSFTGWIAALAELANITQYPNNFFGKALFAGSSGKAVTDLVLQGRADAGILHACELEALIARGEVPPSALKIVGPKNYPHFACAASTQLYPDMAFAARPDLSPEIGKRVAAALFAMPATAEGYGWTVVPSYKEVRRVVHRFAYTPGTESKAEVSAVTNRYKYALLIGFLILAGSVLYGISVSLIVRRRTKELVQIIDEKTSLENTAKHDRDRLSQLERAGIVSELSSMIAHELRQPVASLVNYADGLSLYLGGRGKDPIIDEATREIAHQAERVSDIVERVRRYAKQQSNLQTPLDFCEVVKTAYATFCSSTEHSGVRVSAQLAETAPIEGDPLELELLTVNLLKNALHAARTNPSGKSEIKVRLSEDSQPSGPVRWVLEVEDNGLPVSDAKLAELSHPVSSDKLEGLGLGLSICRVIAERHAARLSFRRAQPQGLIASLSMPMRRPESESRT